MWCSSFGGGYTDPLVDHERIARRGAAVHVNPRGTRRHLPRLAWLHQTLDQLRATVPPATWEQDWQAHFLRLTALLQDNTTLAERQAAARAASDADRELIAQLLSGRYRP